MKSQLIAIVAAVLVVGCGNPEADRALLKAAYEGNIEAVKQHLADGADVHAKDKYGWTPLHHAAAECEVEGVGYKEIVELLIAEGADVNAMDVLSGSTPLDYAEFEMGNILRKHGGRLGE